MRSNREFSAFRSLSAVCHYIFREVKNMNKNDCTIRLETKEDYRPTENLTRESFWNVYRPGCLEHYVLHTFRQNGVNIPELSFIMEKDGEIIGYNTFTDAFIITDNGENLPVAAMGPICIANRYKRQGYGKQLLDFSLERAKEYGVRAVLLEGNIEFYSKCGFRYASDFGIRYHGLDGGADSSFFLCREFENSCLDGVTGVYYTPEAYYVDEAEAEKFDKSFPKKEKLKLSGQIF